MLNLVSKSLHESPCKTLIRYKQGIHNERKLVVSTLTSNQTSYHQQLDKLTPSAYRLTHREGYFCGISTKNARPESNHKETLDQWRHFLQSNWPALLKNVTGRNGKGVRKGRRKRAEKTADATCAPGLGAGPAKKSLL